MCFFFILSIVLVLWLKNNLKICILNFWHLNLLFFNNFQHCTELCIFNNNFTKIKFTCHKVHPYQDNILVFYYILRVIHPIITTMSKMFSLPPKISPILITTHSPPALSPALATTNLFSIYMDFSTWIFPIY